MGHQTYGLFITQINPDIVLMNQFFDLDIHNTQYSLNGATDFLTADMKLY